MPRYLISFDDGSMDHIPEEDWPAVGEAAHAVVRRPRPPGSGSSAGVSNASKRPSLLPMGPPQSDPYRRQRR